MRCRARTLCIFVHVDAVRGFSASQADQAMNPKASTEEESEEDSEEAKAKGESTEVASAEEASAVEVAAEEAAAEEATAEAAAKEEAAKEKAIEKEEGASEEAEEEGVLAAEKTAAGSSVLTGKSSVMSDASKPPEPSEIVALGSGDRGGDGGGGDDGGGDFGSSGGGGGDCGEVEGNAGSGEGGDGPSAAVPVDQSLAAQVRAANTIRVAWLSRRFTKGLAEERKVMVNKLASKLPAPAHAHVAHRSQ